MGILERRPHPNREQFQKRPCHLDSGTTQTIGQEHSCYGAVILADKTQANQVMGRRDTICSHQDSGKAAVVVVTKTESSFYIQEHD